MADTPQNLAAGSLAADWPVVWQQHQRWLQTVVRARLRDSWAVEDCLQEVAASAFRHFAQLQDHSKIAPWLYRIAIREVCRFRRRTSGQAQAWDVCRLDEIPSTRAIDPLDWMMADELVARVQRGLRQLSSQDREMLMLKHGENWSYQQIADNLGLTLDKVIYRLTRARRRLRYLLSVEHPDGAIR